MLCKFLYENWRTSMIFRFLKIIKDSCSNSYRGSFEYIISWPPIWSLSMLVSELVSTAYHTLDAFSLIRITFDIAVVVMFSYLSIPVIFSYFSITYIFSNNNIAIISRIVQSYLTILHVFLNCIWTILIGCDKLWAFHFFFLFIIGADSSKSHIQKFYI